MNFIETKATTEETKQNRRVIRGARIAFATALGTLVAFSMAGIGCSADDSSDDAEQNLTADPPEKLVGAYEQVGADSPIDVVFEKAGTFFAEQGGKRVSGKATTARDKLGSTLSLTNNNKGEALPFGDKLHFLKTGKHGVLLARADKDGTVRQFNKVDSYCSANADCDTQGLAACSKGFSCSATHVCSCGLDGTPTSATCGNGKVDQGEACDGTPGCDVKKCVPTPTVATQFCGGQGEIHVWAPSVSRGVTFEGTTAGFMSAKQESDCTSDDGPQYEGMITIVPESDGKLVAKVAPKGWAATVALRGDCMDEDSTLMCQGNGAVGEEKAVYYSVFKGKPVYLWIDGATDSARGQSYTATIGME